MYGIVQVAEEISKCCLLGGNGYGALLVGACCTNDLTRLMAQTQAESLAEREAILTPEERGVEGTTADGKAVVPTRQLRIHTKYARPIR